MTATATRHESIRAFLRTRPQGATSDVISRETRIPLDVCRPCLSHMLGDGELDATKRVGAKKVYALKAATAPERSTPRPSLQPSLPPEPGDHVPVKLQPPLVAADKQRRLDAAAEFWRAMPNEPAAPTVTTPPDPLDKVMGLPFVKALGLTREQVVAALVKSSGLGV